MEIQGKLIQVLPLQSGIGQQSQKEWKKQEYVIETTGPYPKKICFNLWGDNIDRFMLKEGEDITVQIDLESREYNGRWYTDVKAWRVDRGFVSLQPNIPTQPQPMTATTPMGTNPTWPTAQPTTVAPQMPVSPQPSTDIPSTDELPF